MSIAAVTIANQAPQELEKYNEAISKLHFQDRQHQFTTMTKYCFANCIKTFGRREVNGTERKCVESCVDKYIATWDRALQRYQQLVVPTTDLPQ